MGRSSPGTARSRQRRVYQLILYLIDHRRRPRPLRLLLSVCVCVLAGVGGGRSDRGGTGKFRLSKLLLGRLLSELLSAGVPRGGSGVCGRHGVGGHVLGGGGGGGGGSCVGLRGVLGGRVEGVDAAVDT